MLSSCALPGRRKARRQSGAGLPSTAIKRMQEKPPTSPGSDTTFLSEFTRLPRSLGSRGPGHPCRAPLQMHARNFRWLWVFFKEKKKEKTPVKRN